MRKTFMTSLVICALVISVLAISFGVALAQEPACTVKGGGIIGDTGASIRIALNCVASDPHQTLRINLGKGVDFRLDTLTSSNCFDDPSIEPDPPPCDCDTYFGAGVGTYNGIEGYLAEWIITDAGEPGNCDHAEVLVTSPSGFKVIELDDFLSKGNFDFRNAK